jgi:hypothetical protein
MLIRSAIVPGEGGGARVDTYVAATARNPEGSTSAVACASTQRLEREIAARVRFHAEGGGGHGRDPVSVERYTKVVLTAL